MQPGRLLLLDDEGDVLELVERHLRQRDHAVTTACDGQAALDLLQQSPYDLLIADLGVPGVSGLTLVNEAKANRPDLEIVILADANALDEAVEAMRAGKAFDAIAKPLQNLTQLVVVVERALEWRRMRLENRELVAELARVSVTDPLTGVFNRRKLDEQLTYELRRAQRYGRPLACAMLDIDRFKDVNDTFGHLVGDEVLKAVARLLRENTRSADFVFRYGGDEFCLLLPETSKSLARETLERLRATLAGYAFHLPQAPALQRVVASFGLAVFPDDAPDGEELLIAADKALYQAKQTEGNRVCMAG